MAFKIYKSENYFIINDTSTGEDVLRQVRDNVRWEKKDSKYSFFLKSNLLLKNEDQFVKSSKDLKQLPFSNIYGPINFADTLDPYGSAWDSESSLDLFLSKNTGYIHQETIGADANYDVKNTIGDILVSGSIPSGDLGAPVVPNISFTDSNGTTSSVPAGIDIVATSCIIANDTDAQNFIDATGITDATMIDAINTFVIGAKTHLIWNDLDKIYPFVGGTSTPHTYNLKNALADGTFYGGVTHDSNGVTFNGSTGYFDTGWATNSGNVYNRHYSQYLVSQSMSGVWSGSFDGANLFGMRIDAGRSLSYMGFNNLEASTLINLDRASVYCVTIDSSSVGKMYNNGNLVKTNATSIQGSPTTGTVFVGALNSSGSPTFYHNSNVRFVTTGNKLDASKQAILNNLVRLFNSMLAR